jgi:segregation and condensation protein B
MSDESTSGLHETGQRTNPLQSNLNAMLEALLFVASGPVAPGQLAEALEISLDQVEAALTQLAEDYSVGRGLSLQWHAGKVQLTSAGWCGPLIERFLGLEATARLSRAALETLAIVAYRQPVTRPGVDAIRGVNSDGVMKSLLNKGMIQEAGRAETPGRPILYSITGEFLQHFGLNSLADLPPYDVPEEGEMNNQDSSLLKD